MKESQLRQIIKEEIYKYILLNESDSEFESEELRHLKVDLNRAEKRLNNARSSNDNVEYNRASTQYNKALRAIEKYKNAQERKKFRVTDITKIMTNNGVTKKISNVNKITPTYVMDRIRPDKIIMYRVDKSKFDDVLNDLIEAGFDIKSTVEPTNKMYQSIIELNNDIH